MMLDRTMGFVEVERPNGTSRFRQGDKLFFQDGSPCYEQEPAAPVTKAEIKVAATTAFVIPAGAERFAKEKFFKLLAICRKQGFVPANKVEALAFLAANPPEV